MIEHPFALALVCCVGFLVLSAAGAIILCKISALADRTAIHESQGTPEDWYWHAPPE